MNISFVNIEAGFTQIKGVRPICNKSNVAGKFLHYVRYFEKHTGYTTKNICTDAGKEFKCILSKLVDNDVKVSKATSYTPDSNGSAEQKYQPIISSMRACVYHANLHLQ